MSPSEYAVAVRRTVSPFFYPECVDGQALELALSDFVAASKRLDIFKKAAYYGKGESVEQPLQFTGNKNYLHAVLGICTEAGELAENIMNGLNGKRIDFVNVVEEIGDLLYFINMACSTTGFTIEEIMDMNINKLKARYPEKFTEEHALNRDIDAEMQAMMGDKPFDV